TACGGSSSRQSVSITVAISILPVSTNLLQGGTQTFTATVTGSSNVGVNWTVQEGPGGGTITNAGVYTAPSANGTFHVVATSQADTSKSATATITVPAVGIFLDPTGVSMGIGESLTFTFGVFGTVNRAVTFSISEGAAGGAITNSGIYTAPATFGTFHIVVTSVAAN